MTSGAPAAAGNAWVEDGRRASAALDHVHSAVVIGRDAEAAAWVALGIGQEQATKRRVAIADLVGEVAPLQSLVDPESDPHGISDSFLYGVSLNKIAHPADRSGNLFVLPSGSEAVAVEDVFRSDRWRRLASGFREVGALLLLVAHADTPGLDALAGQVDGVVIAGDAAGALADAPPPLAVVAPTRRRPRAATPAPSRADVPNAAVPPDAPRPAWRRWALIATLAIILAGALSLWVIARPAGKTGDVPRRAGPRRADTSRPAAADSTHRADTTALGAAPAAAPNASDTSANAALPTLTVANPADSASAVRYSVYLGESNSQEALIDPRTQATLPPTILAPLVLDGGVWYRTFVGAYPTHAGADSLLAALHERGLVGQGSGDVKNTPYALLVADRVPATDVRARVQVLLKKNVPVYALSRGDGTMALYAGAFERPDQAAWLARALRAAGLTPTLVYRTGRSL